MFDLEPDEEEIDPTDDHILQVILGLGVLKLDMQTILDTHIHLDTTVDLRGYAIAVNPNVLLTDDVGHATRHGDAHKVAQLDVDAVVGLVLLLDVLEVEVEGLGVLQLARGGKLLHQREELVVIAAIKEHLYGADELHLDSGVLKPLAVLGPNRDGALDRLAVHVKRRLLPPVLVQLDIDHRSVVAILEDDVNVHWGREEVGHDGQPGGVCGRCV